MWKEGKRHGLGVYKFDSRDVNFDKYKGEFEENMFHGKGILT